MNLTPNYCIVPGKEDAVFGPKFLYGDLIREADIRMFKFLSILSRLHAMETVLIDIKKKIIGRISGNAQDQGSRSLKMGEMKVTPKEEEKLIPQPRFDQENPIWLPRSLPVGSITGGTYRHTCHPAGLLHLMNSNDFFPCVTDCRFTFMFSRNTEFSKPRSCASTLLAGCWMMGECGE